MRLEDDFRKMQIFVVNGKSKEVSKHDSLQCEMSWIIKISNVHSKHFQFEIKVLLRVNKCFLSLLINVMKVAKLPKLRKINSFKANSFGDKKPAQHWNEKSKHLFFCGNRQLRNRFQLNGKAISWKLEVSMCEIQCQKSCTSKQSFEFQLFCFLFARQVQALLKSGLKAKVWWSFK